MSNYFDKNFINANCKANNVFGSKDNLLCLFVFNLKFSNIVNSRINFMYYFFFIVYKTIILVVSISLLVVKKFKVFEVNINLSKKMKLIILAN